MQGVANGLSKTQNNFGTYGNKSIQANNSGNGNDNGNTLLNQRSQSTGKNITKNGGNEDALKSQFSGKNFNKNGLNEDNLKSQSYKNRAYINNCKTGTT